MSTYADREMVWIFNEDHVLYPRFHAQGEYIPLEDIHAKDASGKAKQMSKCGLLLVSNPFGIYSTRTWEHAKTLRRDHARAFAAPCLRCYP